MHINSSISFLSLLINKTPLRRGLLLHTSHQHIIYPSANHRFFPIQDNSTPIASKTHTPRHFIYVIPFQPYTHISDRRISLQILYQLNQMKGIIIPFPIHHDPFPSGLIRLPEQPVLIFDFPLL